MSCKTLILLVHNLNRLCFRVYIYKSMVEYSQVKLASFAKWPTTIPNINSTIESACSETDNTLTSADFSSDHSWSNAPWYKRFYQCKLCRFEGERTVMWRHIQDMHIYCECHICGSSFKGLEFLMNHQKAGVYILQRFSSQCVENATILSTTNNTL